MELLFGLNQKDGVWIDGSHKAFDRTEYEGLKFKVKITSLTRSQIRTFSKAAEISQGKIDQNIYMPKIFMACCVDWELKDETGAQIPFTEENKRAMVERFPGFTNLVASACLDVYIKTEAESAERMEAEIKN